MSSDSNGAQDGRAASSQDEMAAFDALPSDVRQLLNYAALDYSALQLLLAAPPRLRTSVPVFMPNEQAALIAAIRAQGAHMRPLTPRQRGRSKRL